MNKMREIKLEKIILSAGGVDKELEKAKKLLSIISERKVQVVASSKRIPDFGVRPGLEVGVRVTIRGEAAKALLKRLLGAVANSMKKKKIAENHFSFGIKEYIEIPGMKYERDIGIRGLNVTLVFARAGLRVKRKKIKSGQVPHKQFISEEEIIKYMEDNFGTVFV